MPNPIPYACPTCGGSTIITPNGNRQTPGGYRRFRVCKACGYRFHTVTPRGGQEQATGAVTAPGYQVTRKQLPVGKKRRPSLKRMRRELVFGIYCDLRYLGYISEARRAEQARIVEAKNVATS